MTRTHALPKQSNWQEGWTPGWIAAFAILAVAILALLAAVLLHEYGPASDAAEQRALEERLARNAELEREIAAVEAEPDPACPPGLVRSDATPRSGTALSARSEATAPEAEIAPTEGVTAPTEGATLSNRELVALLNDATALVLTETGSASGFFIAPDLLVTNRHAVEDSGGMIYVTSKALGRVHPGQVLAISPSGTAGAEDFALVRVADAPARRTLGFSGALEPLMPVVAAGYPGLTIVHDTGFRALLAGDITAAPELVLNRGEVQVVQRSPQGLDVIAHSGRILKGNSGGPLVDACGRVVGINTYAAIDASQAGQVSYAIAAAELVRFATEHGAPVNLAQTACGG